MILFLFLLKLDVPSTTTSDLRLLLNDLTNYKSDKRQQNLHKETHHSNKRELDDIEDDLALILNDKQPPKPHRSIEPIEDYEQPK